MCQSSFKVAAWQSPWHRSTKRNSAVGTLQLHRNATVNTDGAHPRIAVVQGDDHEYFAARAVGEYFCFDGASTPTCKGGDSPGRGLRAGQEQHRWSELAGLS